MKHRISLGFLLYINVFLVFLEKIRFQVSLTWSKWDLAKLWKKEMHCKKEILQSYYFKKVLLSSDMFLLQYLSMSLTLSLSMFVTTVKLELMTKALHSVIIVSLKLSIAIIIANSTYYNHNYNCLNWLVKAFLEIDGYCNRLVSNRNYYYYYFH